MTYQLQVKTYGSSEWTVYGEWTRRIPKYALGYAQDCRKDGYYSDVRFVASNEPGFIR